MSRLIVKNLPKNITDVKIKELFSQKGQVTDVQLKYTKDGKFRRFAFVGFKTEEQAETAKNYFDKSCIDTSRISVENCAALGDPTKPKSWSKYAVDSSVNASASIAVENEEHSSKENAKPSKKESKAEKKEKKKKEKKNEGVRDVVKEAIGKHKNDPMFMEFLESHSTPGAKKLLEDQTLFVDNKKKDSDEDSENSDEEDDAPKEEAEKEDKKIADKVISDLEYMEALKKKKQDNQKENVESEKKPPGHGPDKFFTVKLRGLAYGHKKKDIKEFFRPLKAKSIRLPPKIKGIAYVGFKTEQHLKKALLKNKSFLAGKQIFVMRYEQTQESKEDTKEEGRESTNKWKKQEEALKGEESIAESGRMFVRNLSYATTEDDLRKLFEYYGPLTEVNLPVDKITRKLKGFGTITFLMPEHAVKAYTELDGSVVGGRMLHLLPGKAKPDPLENIDQKGMSFKEKKELKDKATASSSHNWNTLFLGQNAVADAIATTYNTTKEKVLEDGSKGMSAAVKLALGETQLVQDTKKFLEENDVCLDAFNQAPNKRSGTVILVKNLPAGSPVSEIRELFAKHGELGRVVMPPSGITALIEFLEPSEARKAFLKVAYTKYKHMPLYLEWAPDNSFSTEAPKSRKNQFGKVENINQKISEKKIIKPVQPVEPTEEEDEDEEEPEPDTTLFVKNINFATTEDHLKTYFAKCGPIHYASIASKNDPNNPGGKLSMGYGFVRYKKKADTEHALKVLQMSVLDGKTLELKRSERTLSNEVQSTKKSSKVSAQTGTKILIRNVPFQANIQEITELFKAFGELKAVRLPKKFVGAEKHRGFAFVEYYTKTEAKKAFNSLCQSTHLYGRRLVLEWAQTEEGVEDIRKRTAKHFHQDETTKRNKKGTLNPEEVGLEAE